jgi:PEP-CTERM motif
MRLFASFAIVAALALPVVAHADTTFTFTPTGGSAITFELSSVSFTETSSPYDYAYYNVDSSQVSTVAAFGSDEGVYFDANYGYGPTPFDLQIVTASDTEYLLDGAQLFTGTVADPSYIDGTYTLAGDQAEGNGIGGTLVITGGSASATPEPSSLVLLGSGTLSLAGAVRRRMRKA